MSTIPDDAVPTRNVISGEPFRPRLVAPRAPARTEVERRLQRHIATAMADPSPEQLAALRAVLTCFVDAAKADGASRPQVVATVDALARESMRDGQGSRASTTTMLRAHLADWCGRAYCDDAWW